LKEIEMLNQKTLRAIAKIVGRRNAEKQDWLASRAARAALVNNYAENGEVALVSSGMDCDGVRYSGAVSLCAAVPMVVEKAMDSAYEWADGPMTIVLARPSDVADLEYESRDLALEAFENGHSHVLYG
jgi:hypothetical protein